MSDLGFIICYVGKWKHIRNHIYTVSRANSYLKNCHVMGGVANDKVFNIVKNGISDMRYMSDAYLAEDLQEEYAEQNG